MSSGSTTPTLSDAPAAPWHALVDHRQLSLLLDFDGTLVELAATPEHAVPRERTIRLLAALVDVGVDVVIVSGRPRATVDPLVALCPHVRWFAEHAAWSYERGVWRGPADDTPELAPLVATLQTLADVPGARTERKSLAFCVHWRGVPAAQRVPLVAAVERACQAWLSAHADFELLPGCDHVEIRRRSVTKGDAVRAVRDAAPGTRIIAIGDDHTDEDMFARLEPDEAAIVVGKRLRSLHATASLAGPDAVHAFLTWILDMRRGSPRTPPPLGPAPDGRRREARSLGPDRGILAP